MAAQRNRTPSNGKMILITGSTGFIGSHITAAYLERGYLVRVAVRSQAAISHVFSTHEEYADRLSLCIVPDLTLRGAFDSAVSGVYGVRDPVIPCPGCYSHFWNIGLPDICRLFTQHPHSTLVPRGRVKLLIQQSAVQSHS
jgi:short subunit dehydrogenase-like uncharacterized protein